MLNSRSTIGGRVRIESYYDLGARIPNKGGRAAVLGHLDLTIYVIIGKVTSNSRLIPSLEMEGADAQLLSRHLWLGLC